jgi:hypothetical protein
MISDQHRFIFVHINKTGGTSIEKVFNPQADQEDVPHKHGSASFYQRKFPRHFREYFKFSFVRNPWDWLVSRYHWSRDHQGLFNCDFRELLFRMKNGSPLCAAAPWMEKALAPQLDRLTVDGKLAMDFVGKFENLQGDFDRVCSILGIETTPLPHVFQSRRGTYAQYYDDETREIVERVYAADIAAFDYRFGD